MDNNSYYYEDRSNVPFNRNKRPPSAASFAMVIVGALLICVISALISSAVAGKKIDEAKSAAENVIIYKSVDEHPLPAIRTDVPLSVTQIAGLAKNSVVEIKTETIVYGGFYGNYISSGAGSGVIISESGYIITNLHVIDQADNITVTLADGTSSQASVRGFDEKTDIAVIRLETNYTGLIPAVIGNSDNLVAGETVVAIGNPLGSLGGTVTDGIISAVQRQITVDDVDMVLLQTNAAVNPGNSGGGLFNSYGELVGIINAKNADEGVEGIGFAVPINPAGAVAASIIERGYMPGRVDTEALKLYEIQNVSAFSRYKYVGLYVVDAYGPFLANDYIVSVEGKSAKTKKEWKNRLINYDAGETISVVVQRNNLQITLEYTLPEKTA